LKLRLLFCKIQGVNRRSIHPQGWVPIETGSVCHKHMSKTIT